MQSFPSTTSNIRAQLLVITNNLIYSTAASSQYQPLFWEGNECVAHTNLPQYCHRYAARIRFTDDIALRTAASSMSSCTVYRCQRLADRVGDGMRGSKRLGILSPRGPTSLRLLSWQLRGIYGAPPCCFLHRQVAPLPRASPSRETFCARPC